MDIKAMAMVAAKAIDDKKGQDIAIIDIGAKAAFADYMIIASGGSDRQVKALCDEVEDKLAEQGVIVKAIEGKNNSGWILMDYGDIIVNLLTVDLRERYNIEKVWADPKFANEVLGWKATATIDDTMRSAWAWQCRLRERGIM